MPRERIFSSARLRQWAEPQASFHLAFPGFAAYSVPPDGVPDRPDVGWLRRRLTEEGISMPPWKGVVNLSFTAANFNNYLTTVRLQNWRPQFVVVHNTFIPKLGDWHSVDGHKRMMALQSFYRDQQHWSAGPHLFVADDLIWAFTPLNTPGVHSPSWNAISWGVELVGDYMSEPFGDAVRHNAVAALAGLHRLAGLDPNTLHFHREDPLTTHKQCPGDNVVKADLIRDILNRVAADSPGEHTPGAAAAGAGG
jgi:hypothetical protein